MSPLHLISSIVFVLSWLGAVGAWATGAYSLARVFTGGSRGGVTGYRTRAYQALVLSVTFVVTGVLSAISSGALTHLHV